MKIPRKLKKKCKTCIRHKRELRFESDKINSKYIRILEVDSLGFMFECVGKWK